MTTISPLAGRDFSREFRFTASRSSGPGGQNVNKVSTRIELRFNVETSELLTESEKALIMDRLKNRISRDGILLLVSQTERSQAGNRQKVVERFYTILSKALTPKKPRKPTRISHAATEKRRTLKKMRSELKQLRSGTPEE